MGTRGWADIAYSFLVCPHGYVFEGRGIGKRSAANGTNDGNARYYAICGLFGQGDPFTEEMKTAYKEAINHCRSSGAGSEVKPHSAFKATACPGLVRHWLESGMQGGTSPAPTPTPPAQDGVPTAPAYPLPADHWYGTVSPNPRNHSGYWEADRAGVSAIRNRLRERRWNIAAGDRYDQPLADIIAQFQREKGLGVDGRVGPQTWPRLWTSPIT